jgi:hypothetical protein
MSVLVCEKKGRGERSLRDCGWGWWVSCLLLEGEDDEGEEEEEEDIRLNWSRERG